MKKLTYGERLYLMAKFYVACISLILISGVFVGLAFAATTVKIIPLVFGVACFTGALTSLIFAVRLDLRELRGK